MASHNKRGAQRRKKERQQRKEQRHDDTARMTENQDGHDPAEIGGGIPPVPEPWYRRTDWWVAAFSAVLAVTTIAYTVVSCRQLNVTASALRAAEESNKLVAESNRISKDGNEASGRAWVVVSDEASITCPIMNQSAEITYHLTNSGARPAIQAESHSAVRILPVGPDYVFPASPEYQDDKALARVSQPSVSVIGPGQKQHDTLVSFEITPEQYAGLPRFTHTLFAYGKVVYEDGYGVKRHTHWCRRLVPNPVNRCASKFVWCGSYNDAD